MKPLTGLKVLDFSHVIAGPFATFYLAQLGAEVTKVEKPGGGDVMRGNAKGASQFAAFNAGKQCVQIDIQTPEGQAQAMELALQADVMVDNFRPGVLAKYGLGHEAVQARNPKLIFCGISGYGTQYEPWRERGAYDHVIQAATGMAMLAGEPGGPPVKTGFPVVDVMTGVLGAFAVTAAVQERQRTGKGQFIDISMWGASLQLMYPFTVEAMASGMSPPRVGNKGYSGSPAAEYFETTEGWIALGANTAEQIVALYGVLGWDKAQAAVDLERGPGFARARDPQAFRDKLAARLREKPANTWEAELNAAGIPAARVRQLGEFTAEAQQLGALVAERQTLDGTTVALPGLGWFSKSV